MSGMLAKFRKAMQSLETEIDDGKKDLKAGKGLPQGHMEKVEQLRLMEQGMKQAKAYALKVEEFDLYQLLKTTVDKVGKQSVWTKCEIEKG